MARRRILLLALALVASAVIPAADAAAAKKLRPPTASEESALLDWAQRRGWDPDTRVDRICVHRRRPRYAVLRLLYAGTDGEGAVARRRGGRWRYVTGGSGWSTRGVLGDLLRGSCRYRRPAAAERLTAATTLAATAFGPIAIGMTPGAAQRATSTRLRVQQSINPPCGGLWPKALTGFAALTDHGLVRRVAIYAAGGEAPRFATAEGLRLGDPAARVAEVYGAPDRDEPAAYYEAGRQYTYELGEHAGDTLQRIVITDDAQTVVEIRTGLLPEVRYIEGCA